MSAPQCCVGMEVANAPLAIALRPTGERWAVTNEETGIGPLVVQLQALPPTLMVLDATGGDHRAVVAALAAAVWPIVVVNLRQVGDVAKATGPLATTDVLEARAVAHVAAAMNGAADRRAEPPRACAASSAGRHRGPSRLARSARGSPG